MIMKKRKWLIALFAATALFTFASCSGGGNEDLVDPNTPNTPDVPDTPSTPDTPDTPDTPSTPDTPDVPDNPSSDKVKVSFVVEEEEPEVTEITKGSTVGRPDDPKLPGKVFEGWLDASGNVFDFTTQINEDITLTAKFRNMTIFELMSSDENCTLSEDFDSYEATDKLDEFVFWTNQDGTSALYTDTNNSVGGAKDHSNNYVKLGDGVANLFDDSNKATHLVVDLGYPAIVGTLEGYFEVTLSNGGNSWTLFQFFGADSLESDVKEVFGIRTIDGNFKYRLGGSNDNVGAANSVAWKNDTLYKVYFKFDLDAGTVTLTINDVAVADNLDVSSQLFCLAGFKFVTGDASSTKDGSNKTMKVDNIVLVRAYGNITEFKSNLANQIQSAYDGLDLTKFTLNKNQLDKILADALKDIEEATSDFMAYVATQEAIMAFADVLNDDQQQLVNYVNEVISGLDFSVYKEEIYSPEKYQEINNIINNLLDELKAVSITTDLDTAKAEVDRIKNERLEYLESIPTYAEELGQMIAELPETSADNATILASEEEIRHVKALFDTVSETVKNAMEPTDKEKLQQLVDKLEYLIENPDEMANVTVAYNAAVEEVNQAYSEYDQSNYETNCSSLQAAYNNGLSELERIKNEAQEKADSLQLTSELAQGYIEQLTEQVQTILQAMSAVLDDVAQLKVDKKSEADTYYNENKVNYTSDYNLDAFEAAYQELLTLIESTEDKAELQAIDAEVVLGAILTDEEQIAYNNLPEYKVSEQIADQKIMSLGEKTGKISSGTVIDDFVTYVGTTQASWKTSEGGLSIKSAQLKITTSYPNAKITIVYYSTTSGRKFLFYNENAEPESKDYTTGYEPNTWKELYEPSNNKTKCHVFECEEVGTYAFDFDNSEHKIKYIILDDKKEVQTSYKVEDIQVTTSEESNFDSVAAFKAALTITLVLAGTDSVVVDPSTVTLEYLNELESPVDEAELVSGTYTIKISYKDLTHTGSVSITLENIVFNIAE